jgi:hypothetical protein
VGDKCLDTSYYPYIYIKDGSIYRGIVKNKHYHYYSSGKEVNISDELVDEKVLYSKEKYGNITDYKRLQEPDIWESYIASDKGLFKYSDVETEECKKYEDIKCERDFVRVDKLDKYKDEIKLITTDYIVTNNNYIFSVHDIFNYNFDE